MNFDFLSESYTKRMVWLFLCFLLILGVRCYENQNDDILVLLVI
jgi:hypothetical protein